MRTICLIGLILFTPALAAVQELSNASPEYITQYYQKALENYNKGQYEASLNDIRHVIKSNMQDYRLRYLAAHNHWRQKNYASAIVHIRTAMAVKPLEASPHIDLCLMYIDQKNYYRALTLSKAAIDKLQAAGQLVPAKLYSIASRTNLVAGSKQAALELAQKAKAAFNEAPKDQQHGRDKIEAIILEGRAHLALGNYENADLAFQWALKLEKQNYPDSPYTYNLMGYLNERRANAEADAAKKTGFKSEAVRYYKLAVDKGSGAIKEKAQANLNRVSQ